jgi:hypothetical protein
MATYSLISKIVFGVLFASSGLIAEYFLWAKDVEMSRRIAQLVVSAIVGPIAVVGAMFLISLFYYAPSAVLESTANEAAKNSRALTQKENASDHLALTKTNAALRAQIKDAPCSHDLTRVEGERNNALSRVDDSEERADRIAEAADAVSNAEIRFDQAYIAQKNEWELLSGLTEGMTFKPNVANSDAMAEIREYGSRKTQTATAESKLHESVEALRNVLRLNR